jgi:hypothetical protein
MRLILIITAALFLSSCALPAEYIPSIFSNARKEKPPAPEPRTPEPVKPLGLLMEEHRDLIICCRSVKEFYYTRLNLPETKNFKIDKNSRASSFNTGRSFFRSFELPEFSTPYTVSIKSYVQGNNLTEGYIFSPAIILLNEDHQILRTIIRGLFEYTGDGPAKPLSPGAGLIGKIEITHEIKDYRYMIILTPGKMLGRAHNHSPIKTAPAALTGKKVPLIHAPAGKLRIELYEETSKKIKIRK